MAVSRGGGGGVSAPGGVWGVSAPGGSATGGCLILGVSAPGGVCSRGCLLLGGVSASGGCGIPPCTDADTPSPSVDRQTPVKT